VCDDARNENLSVGQLNVLPHLPFVLVPRVRSFERIGLRPNFEDEVNQRLEGDVRRVRSVPTAPAHMIAHPILRNSGERVIKQLNAAFEISVNVLLVHFAEQPIVLMCQKCVVKLNQKAGIDNGPVFFPERIRQSGDDGVFVRVITVDPKSARTHWRRDRQESLFHFDLRERSLEVLNILRDGGLSAIADRTGAVP
jgi:hypothetical protein